MADTDSDQGVSVAPHPMNDPKATIEEVFNSQIETARQRVEALCVQKAKLEALNMHKMPFQQVRSLLDLYPF